MAGSRIIHCIGDSHASFFSGYDYIQDCYPAISPNKYPQLKAYRLGAVLAYNLAKEGTTEQGHEKLQQLLGELNKGDELLLCFGEIDNRCHLVKQADLQKKTLEEIAVTCVASYFKAVDEIADKGFTCMIFGALPSCNTHNPDYPTYGTMEQRNRSTWFFNEALRRECEKRGIVFIDLFSHLTRDNRTKVNYFFDGVHLGQIAFPFFLKEISGIPHLANLFAIGRFSINRMLVRSRFRYISISIKKRLSAVKRIFSKTGSLSR